MGLTGVLGGLEVVQKYDTLYAINKLVSLASNGIFSILPMAVCYSATKRFGGNPVLGMVVGAIMLDGSLANAYQAAQGLAQPEIISLFGFKIELVGFQGGIIIALMMGYVVAKLDVIFSTKKDTGCDQTFSCAIADGVYFYRSVIYSYRTGGKNSF